MLSKIFKGLFLALAVVLVLVSLLYNIREVSGIVNWKSSGTIQSQIHLRADSVLVFVRIDTSDFASSPYPDSGDILLTLDDSVANYPRWHRYFREPNQQGQEYSLTFAHENDTLKTLLITRPIRKLDFGFALFMTILRFLTGFSYLGVGLWAYFKRPDSQGVRVLALFCFSMSGFTIFAINLGLEGYATISLSFLYQIMIVMSGFGLLFGAFWLHLQLLFPQPKKLILAHPTLPYLVCYLPLALAFLLSVIARARGWNNMVLVLIAILIVQVITGSILLVRSHLNTTNLLEKRQTRLVLWGSGVGLLGLVLLFLFALIARTWLIGLPQIYLLGFVSFIFLGLLLSPISVAYALGRYHLLEVEGKIRRGTRYIATTVILLVGFYVMIYLISGVLLTSLGIESRGIILLLALLLTIGFTPAQRKIQSFTENQIYPERNKMRMMLNDFLRQSLITADKESFWSELEKRLREVLKVDLVYPVIRAKDGGALIHWSGEPTPFDRDSKIVKELISLKSKPIMLDEALASEKVSLSEQEKDWILKNGIALVIPLVTHSSMVGFLAIGSKLEREDFEAKDIEILGSLASQVAVAAENIMLLEENFEKRRLEDELGRAREIQQGLLPRQIPRTPGLQVAAKSYFCTEVAGDYHDVINLDNYRTVLAVGDVSGKGAGAAILMSNLQASLRTTVRAGIKLSDAVSEINELLFANTPPDQFITFFVGVYDKRASTLSYVNAGHNPPLVLRKDGEIEELSTGGLVLGAFAGVLYEQGSIELKEGDLLFLYTDGISEALNSKEEMFGENRIKDFLLNKIHFSVERLLENLEGEVLKFIENTPLADDFTILAARVSSKE
jgi:serine phosphatase RsbU (regulator of sigma subunit)